MVGLPGTLRGPLAPWIKNTPPAASMRAGPVKNAAVMACQCRDEAAALEMTRELLKKDVELAVTPDPNGNLPVHAAAKSGFPSVVVSHG